jgi:hypothetical protein
LPLPDANFRRCSRRLPFEHPPQGVNLPQVELLPQAGLPQAGLLQGVHQPKVSS